MIPQQWCSEMLVTCHVTSATLKKHSTIPSSKTLEIKILNFQFILSPREISLSFFLPLHWFEIKNSHWESSQWGLISSFYYFNAFIAPALLQLKLNFISLISSLRSSTILKWWRKSVEIQFVVGSRAGKRIDMKIILSIFIFLPHHQIEALKILSEIIIINNGSVNLSIESEKIKFN